MALPLDKDPELVAHTEAAIVLKNTQITADQLRAALRVWRQQFFAGETKDVIAVLIEAGVLPRYQKKTLKRATDYALARKDDKRFGKRAFVKGYITKTQLDESLAFQKQLFKALHEVKRLETVLMDDGFLTRAQCDEIWGEYAAVVEQRREKGLFPPPATVERAAKSIGIASPAAGKGDGEAALAPAGQAAGPHRTEPNAPAPTTELASGRVEPSALVLADADAQRTIPDSRTNVVESASAEVPAPPTPGDAATDRLHMGLVGGPIDSTPIDDSLLNMDEDLRLGDPVFAIGDLRTETQVEIEELDAALRELELPSELLDEDASDGASGANGASGADKAANSPPS